MFGVFRVKNHDFTQKSLIFSNFWGGRAPGASPHIRPCNNNISINSKLHVDICLYQGQFAVKKQTNQLNSCHYENSVKSKQLIIISYRFVKRTNRSVGEVG